MAVELIVPSVGESITEVEIGDWLKREGEPVKQDEPVVVIETEKVTVELPAPASGVVTKMLKHKGDKAAVGDVIGYMELNGVSSRHESPVEGRKVEPPPPMPKEPEAKAEKPKAAPRRGPLTEDERHQRKQIGLIVMLQSFALPFLLDQFLIGPGRLNLLIDLAIPAVVIPAVFFTVFRK